MKAAGNDEDQSGAAAVEFAFVMPILFMLVFGIIEFGFIFNRWISVTHAAREGARLLAVGVVEDSTPSDCRRAVPPGPPCLFEGAELRAEEGTPRVGSAVDCEGGNAETSEPAPPARDEVVMSDGSREVSMTCTTNYNLRLFKLLPIRDNVVLRSTATMRREGA